MLQTVFDVAEDVGLPVTFTLVVANAGDPTWPDAITMIEKANARGRRRPASPRSCCRARSV